MRMQTWMQTWRDEGLLDLGPWECQEGRAQLESYADVERQDSRRIGGR